MKRFLALMYAPKTKDYTGYKMTAVYQAETHATKIAVLEEAIAELDELRSLLQRQMWAQRLDR